MRNSHRGKKILLSNEDLLICGSTVKECAHALSIFSNQVVSITLAIDTFLKEKRSFSRSSPLFRDKSLCGVCVWWQGRERGGVPLPQRLDSCHLRAIYFC